MSYCEAAIEDPLIKLDFYKLRKYDEINYEAHFLRTKIDITKEQLSPLDKQMLELFDDYERRIEKQLPIISILSEAPDLAIVRRELVDNAREAAKVAMLIKLLDDQKKSCSLLSIRPIKPRSSPLASSSSTSITKLDTSSGAMKKKATRGRPKNAAKVRPPKPVETEKLAFDCLQSPTQLVREPLSTVNSKLKSSEEENSPSQNQHHFFVTLKIKSAQKLDSAKDCSKLPNSLLSALCDSQASSDVSELKLGSQPSTLLVAQVAQNSPNEENNGSIGESYYQEPISQPTSSHPLQAQKIQQFASTTDVNGFLPAFDIANATSVNTAPNRQMPGVNGNDSSTVKATAHGTDETGIGPLVTTFVPSFGINRVVLTSPLYRASPVLGKQGTNPVFVDPQAVVPMNNVWPSNYNPSGMTPVRSVNNATEISSINQSTKASKVVNTSKPAPIGRDMIYRASVAGSGHQPIEPKCLKDKILEMQRRAEHVRSKLRASAPLHSFEQFPTWSPLYVKTVFEAAARSNVAENKRNNVQQLYDTRFNISITKRQANYLLLHYGLRFNSPSPILFTPVLDSIQNAFPGEIDKIREEVKRRTGFQLSVFDAEFAVQMRKLFLKVYKLHAEPEENYMPYFKEYNRIMPRRPYSTFMALSAMNLSEIVDRTAPSRSNSSSPDSRDKDSDKSESKKALTSINTNKEKSPTIEVLPDSILPENNEINSTNINKKSVTGDDFLGDKKLLLKIRKLYTPLSSDISNRPQVVQEALLKDDDVRLDISQIKQALAFLGLGLKQSLNKLNSSLLTKSPAYFQTTSLVSNGDTTKSHAIWLISNNKRKGNIEVSHLDFNSRKSMSPSGQVSSGNMNKPSPQAHSINLLPELPSKSFTAMNERSQVLTSTQPPNELLGITRTKTRLSDCVTVAPPGSGEPKLHNMNNQQVFIDLSKSDEVIPNYENSTVVTGKSDGRVQNLKVGESSPLKNVDASPSRRFYNKTNSSPIITTSASPLTLRNKENNL
ncbi:uncharacterized protein KQ657_003833 [Scheffersomyces spartinae]|uniref:Uncharacterized protein n=1 Tax=Scheffersomyces spartinae TaxID=45513 RepID=A0A9P7VCJ4_9ASCO|nr:uncharacterized protein KQ657_003833 [Scheffersomyces spartinae]KAG7195305.1 hypothetical protein KQ657_003833 [Scheffersomyces spartinae]